MPRYFIWYQKSYNERHYQLGPYFDHHMAGERKLIHTLAELRKMPFGKTIKKRLESSRSGTEIRLHRVSLGWDFYTQRLTDAEVQLWRDHQNTLQELAGVKQQIAALIPKKLTKQRLALEKKINKATKKNSWLKRVQP